MTLQFKNVFAGKGMRRGKMQQQAAVDDATVFSVKIGQRRLTGWRLLAT